MKNNHTKKMIAPIIITAILVIYYFIYFTVLLEIIGLNPILRLLLMVVPVIIGILMIYVCIERIKEIKGGEEDDLSKY